MSTVATGRHIGPSPEAFIAPAVIGMASAGVVAVIIYLAQLYFPAPPERSVLATGAVLTAMFAPAAGVAIIRYCHQPAYATVAVITVIAAILAGIYLFGVSSSVLFRGDFLIWSESDFVNDIVKWRSNYPLYSSDANNESFTYPFGSQLLTYWLASLLGKPTSVPVFRAIQVLFTFGATILATLCCRRLLNLARPGLRVNYVWIALWTLILFLVATNRITNAYTHNLHNDALAQLVTAAAYYLLLRYAEAPSGRLLALMAVIPAAGFLCKQSVVVWFGFYAAFIAYVHWPFGMKRVLAFTAAAAGLLGIVLGACLWTWGEPFYYWVFLVLSKHAVSPLRSFQHLLDTWTFVAAGLFGGWALLRSAFSRNLFGVWLIWLILILLEIWTSGVAWMLNHIGPGCLLAGIWLLAGITTVWEKFEPAAWFEPVLVGAIVLLCFGGMGLVRVPLPSVPADAERYIAALEREFEGYPRDGVLLDAGTWMYMQDGIVMKDRAPAIGERGWSQTADFSGVLHRLRSGYYNKLLLRNYDGAEFWYDHRMWEKSSGIRAAMAENYEVVGVIPGVNGIDGKPLSYLFAPVTVLKAKPRPPAYSTIDLPAKDIAAFASPAGKARRDLASE